MDNITATVDTDLLKQKANEFATKGALKAIEDFYTGYDSPYKKAIMKTLSGNSMDNLSLDLPDIVSLINEHLTIEIDAIANTAVAKTFIPLVAQFLTRQEKIANFSDILKGFIESSSQSDTYTEDFNVSVEKDYKYSWLNIEVSDLKRTYSFTLHEDYQSKQNKELKYKLLSLPHTDKNERTMMKLHVDNATLELPFTRDILKDSFVAHLAGYIISDTIITMDTESFEDDMFPERCHCH